MAVSTENRETIAGRASSLLWRRVAPRAFLKYLAATTGGIVASIFLGRREAEATYTAGSPSDIIDTNLEVQGDLIVDQSCGIGTSSPQSPLDFAGELRNGTIIVADSAGVSKQTFYYGGTHTADPAPIRATWALTAAKTWYELRYSPATTWRDLYSSAGTWQVLSLHTWGECLTPNNWNWDYVASMT